MDKKDFSDLGDQIRSTVENAFDSIDFDRLKKDIGGKAESTLDEVIKNFKATSRNYSEKFDQIRKMQNRNNINVAKKDNNIGKLNIAKRPAGTISGIVYMVLGIPLSIILGILLIICSIFGPMISGFSVITSVSLGILGLFFGGSLILTLKGVSLRKRVKRFKQYVKALNGRSYCSIEEIASFTRKKSKFIIKDLKKMIKVGMFKEAYIDDNQTYLMLNYEVYENYLKLQESLKQRNEQNLEKESNIKDEINDSEKNELNDTIESGRNYIAKIKAANDAILGEEISRKLYRLESITSKIFSFVEKNPKKIPEVHKFTNHYLPITLKLVNAYKELDEQPIQGDNIRRAKDEIEKVLDTINAAFEKLLDDLFEDIALDISTDISVLETLFTQEGLTKNDFKK